MSSRREAGQAAVESAIVLPLVVFLILGTLQLFMMLQGRIMAEYAAARAVRAGSINHGNCRPMMHAAIASLLPTFTQTNTPAKLAAAFGERKNNEFGSTTLSNGTNLSGDPVVWIWRERPVIGDWAGPEDEDFDYSFNPMTLEIRLVFWFPLRIPFADWVITRMLLAHYGMQTYSGVINPLSPAQVANWPTSMGYTAEQGDLASYPHVGQAIVAGQFEEYATGGKYLFPIHATSAMRMMTPARTAAWDDCPNTPSL
ncbi:MAG: pilus assembly protein [Myxococcota bacterium]|nr:pilus assembly protein [Myxococcota bacterium]